MKQDTLITQPAWIVTINAEEAAVYHYEGAKKPLYKREVLTQTLPKASDMVTDQQGQNKNKFMPGGESYTATTNPRTHKKHNFCNEIADYLYAHRQDYERLVVVAAPAMLGMLREELHQEVQKKVVAELNKNLSKFDEHNLPAQLDSIILFEHTSYGFENPRASRYSKGQFAHIE